MRKAPYAVVSLLALCAVACSSGASSESEDTGGQAVLAAPSCAADAAKPLELANEAAKKLAASDKAWDDWRAADAAAKRAGQPSPAEPQTSYCDEVAPGVSVSLADAELQTLKAVRACSALTKNVKDDASLAPLRGVLAKSLTLAVATGAIAEDGRGLKEALDRGVEMWGPGMGAYGSLVHVTFGAGKAKVETLAIDNDGNPGEWKVESDNEISVDGKKVKVRGDEFELKIDEFGVTLQPPTNSDLSPLYDHPSECEA